jgi:hypothetical protein
MRIIINSGPREGEVRDLPIAAARSMIEDGRARLQFPDQFPAGTFTVPQAAEHKAAKKSAKVK